MYDVIVLLTSLQEGDKYDVIVLLTSLQEEDKYDVIVLLTSLQAVNAINPPPPTRLVCSLCYCFLFHMYGCSSLTYRGEIQCIRNVLLTPPPTTTTTASANAITTTFFMLLIQFDFHSSTKKFFGLLFLM